MVVVVDVPGADGGGAFGFAVPGVGVEELFGQDALVALDFAVVPRCVGAGALVPGGVGEHGPGAVACAGGGAVVGDHPHDPRDAVRGEEGSGSVEAPDRGRGGLVR